MRRLLAIVTLSLLTTLGCMSTDTTRMDGGGAESYIRSAAPRFISAFNAGDADALTGFYADDAVLLAPNAEIARGTAAIRDSWASMFPMKPRLNFSADRIVESCDLAYEYGRYQMQMTPPGGSMMSDSGKYATVWRRMPNGEWKIVADMINTSLPAPGM